MKVKHLSIGVGLLVGGLILTQSVLGMTYQDSVNVKFTFDPSISISLSSDALTIEDLVPGNSSNSNTIMVTVSTNDASGYTLNAKVGGTGQTAANSSLVNTTANTSFTSLASNASLTLANFSDNYWGYTTASTVGTSSMYSGLTYNVDKTINKTTNYSGTAVSGYPGTNVTSFTIGAKAASSQIAGDYSNVITFTAVANSAAS